MSRDKFELWSIISRFSWLNKKKFLLITSKKYNRCFQYAVTVVLDYKEIKKNPQKTTKVEPFINKYNWEDINFPSKKDD